MDVTLFIKDPEKKARSLVKSITHSGETDLDRDMIKELKTICKASKDDLLVLVYKECMKYLHKEHAQVRVSTVKLIDYLFQKSHIIRAKLLDNFDVFLELTLAISQKPKVKLKLPPPKKFATLLQELTAKLIHSWHAEYGCGYEKLRYVYKFLSEHRLVDFSAFRVQNHEQLIKQQKLAERQDNILSRSIENRMRELRIIKPDIERLIVQIETSLELLITNHTDSLELDDGELDSSAEISYHDLDRSTQQQHGIANLSQNIAIEFSPYVEIHRDQQNKQVVQNLKELKKELVEGKLPKLLAIEKTLIKRSEQFVNTLREIISLKTKSTNIVLKLSELKIINDSKEGKSCKNLSTLDNIDSSSDDNDFDEFEDVQPKEGLETYIPKSMRSEYGLEAIDPRELDESRRIRLTDESFSSGSSAIASTSSRVPVLTCNVRLETGKLCPRQDKIKCPFHGRIIARDHKGVPLNDKDRVEEEEKLASMPKVPDWQDPQLLRDIKAATGVDLTMPTKKRGLKSRLISHKKLANAKTCDLTPKQRLEKRLRKLTK